MTTPAAHGHAHAHFVVLFDASPVNDPTPWMKQACAATGIKLADINEIGKAMAEDKEAQQALLHADRFGENPKLAPHYLKGLDKVVGGTFKIAVHSLVWIAYGLKPSVCVLDFDNLELERDKATALGYDKYDQLVAHHHKEMETRARKVLSQDRILLLPKGRSDAEKAELAIAHIKKFTK